MRIGYVSGARFPAIRARDVGQFELVEIGNNGFVLTACYLEPILEQGFEQGLENLDWSGKCGENWWIRTLTRLNRYISLHDYE